MREPFLAFVEAHLGRDVVLITCGLPATGKTATSTEVARIKGYPIVSTDLIRRELLKDEDIFDEEVASDIHKRMLVYDETFRHADQALKKSDSVIIDATFVTQPLRRRAAALAAQHNKSLVILHTRCPQRVAIARIMGRTAEDCQSNALTRQAYLNNKAKFEAIDLEDLKQQYPNLVILQITVDTTSDPPDDWCVTGVKRVS